MVEKEELHHMIAFALRDSAERLATLAAEVASPELRRRLIDLARQLSEQASVVDDL